MAIDPTARVADGARIGDGVEIGPYCLIGPQVEIKDGVRLIGHVNVTGVTSIGEGCVVYPFASLGTPPQSTHYRGGATRLVVGSRCQIREHVTLNTGTEAGGGTTDVGDDCFFMGGSHVAHDCHIGHGVTLANNVALGGHVSIGDQAFLGGLVAVHQFARIGECAMIGGHSRIRADVVPFCLAYVESLMGLNVVGLRRRGVKRSELLALRRAYRQLFFGEGVFADKVESVAREFADDPRVGQIVAFIRAGEKRPLLQPRLRRDGDEYADDAV
jgi:UDP-N-acetylglucosamine acyltransferase